MYKGSIKNHISAYSCALTPALIQKAIVLSGLSWGVPPAQYFSMQLWGIQDPVEVVLKHTNDETTLKLQANNDTLLGLPLVLDDSLPPSTVQLRYQGAVLYEIQQLAVPCGFEEEIHRP
jgi:hypothetical protein